MADRVVRRLHFTQNLLLTTTGWLIIAAVALFGLVAAAQNQKVIPSVTRVFRQGQNMYVYLQPYEQGVAAAQPLVAFVSFYHEQTKAFETQPMEMATGLSNRLQTMPFSFSIPLQGLAPGEYECQISVLDPTGQKAALWQAREGWKHFHESSAELQVPPLRYAPVGMTRGGAVFPFGIGYWD